MSKFVVFIAGLILGVLITPCNPKYQREIYREVRLLKLDAEYDRRFKLLEPFTGTNWLMRFDALNKWEDSQYELIWKETQ